MSISSMRGSSSFVNYFPALVRVSWRIADRGGVLQEKSDLVYVAPEPVLSRFERLDDRVSRRGGVRRRMLVLGRVATPHVAADHAQPQVLPFVAHGEALDTAICCRRDFPDQFSMSTSVHRV